MAQKILVAGGLTCTVVGLGVLSRDLVNAYSPEDPSPKYPKSLDGKVYLVTGANSGIGKAVASDLAKRKAKVYMLCRDMVKCEEARKELVLSTRNRFVYCRMCNLASQKSVRDFVDSFEEAQVHGLVNNAGTMEAPRSFSADGVEVHLAVNHIGHFLLTNLLLDRLKVAAAAATSTDDTPRIVFLMNLDYRKGSLDFKDLNFQGTSDRKYSRSEAFRQSQLANMLLVQELARRLQDDGSSRGKFITVNAAYPGIVNTSIKRHMGVDKSMSGSIFWRPILWSYTKTPEQGARTPLFLLLAPQSLLAGSGAESGGKPVSGQLFVNYDQVEVDKVALDSQLARKLWAVDEYWTGLRRREEILGVADSTGR